MPLGSRTASIVAATIWTVVLVVIVVALVVSFRPRPAPDPDATPWEWAIVVVALIASSTTVGALLAAKRPANVIGWLLLAVGACFCTFVLVDVVLGELRLAPGNWQMAVAPLQVLANLALGAGLALAGPMLIVLFPDGRLPSARWRAFPWLVALAIGLGVLDGVLRLDDAEPSSGTAEADPISAAIDFAANALLAGAFVAGVAALVLRARRADAVTRQQLKWFGYVGALTVAIILLGIPLQDTFGDVGFFFGLAGLSLLPIAIGVAVTRYRLYDIDRLINRTLVYVPLTGILGGLYAASVALFQRLFVLLTGDRSDAAIVITTLILASAFTPVRKALEAIVDRRFKPEPGAPTADDAPPLAPERSWERQVERIAERVVARALAQQGPASAQPEGDHDAVPGGDDRR